MYCHGFKCFLGFVVVALEEKDDSLFGIVLAVVLNFVLGNVVMELMQFLAFILVMGDMSKKEEASALLTLFGFLLLFWINCHLRVGK